MVEEVQATDSAFAALLPDGSVVTWGNPNLRRTWKHYLFTIIPTEQQTVLFCKGIKFSEGTRAVIAKRCDGS